MDGKGEVDGGITAIERPSGVFSPLPPPPAAGASSAGRATPRERFRPDIEGMRTIAVGLVLLFHAYDAPFTGGFVGIDLFFVVSGFLITGLLLNERARTGRVSLLRFYARRVRRILPASALVALVTLFATYYWLGFVAGNDVANDAKWTAVFAANIHFATVGADYFTAQLPPSPLQHMWSLGVEEQFYLVWPVLFLLVAVIVRGARHRGTLAAALLLIIGASLAWSVVQTSTNQVWAYYSPLTRACELAVGALIAVLAPTFSGVRPAWVPELLALCGLVGIVASALVLNSSTPYPGSAIVLPVISSALLITAGCANERTIVGRALALRPVQWVGARSYSLYLWHWPLLIIPAQYLAHDLSVFQDTGLLLIAVVSSAITYRLVENPIRHARVLTSRTGLSLAMGAVLIAGTIAIAQWQIATHYGPWNPLIASTQGR